MSPLPPLVAPLFVPANRPERFQKAAESGADAVIVDLEDAVPQALKEEARAALGQALGVSLPVLVRINAPGTPWHEDDLAALRCLAIISVCVPKVETAEGLDRLVQALGEHVRFVAQIETAAGLGNAGAIAAHRSVTQLAFGPADFYLDMDMKPSAEMTSHVLRSLAIASRIAGAASPLDGPFFEIGGDPSALAADCARSKASGAGGKLCIHPSHPRAVRECFAPSAEEVEWAQRVVAGDKGGAAQALDGLMIDGPIVARARAVLRRSGAEQ
jgi:citrate lyase subunit beta/citryl-CoA lyase